MILVTPFCASHDELIILIILNDHVTLLVVISLQVPKLLYLHVADRITALIDPDLYGMISTNQWTFQHLKLRAHKSSLAAESRPSVCSATVSCPTTRSVSLLVLHFNLFSLALWGASFSALWLYPFWENTVLLLHYKLSVERFYTSVELFIARFRLSGAFQLQVHLKKLEYGVNFFSCNLFQKWNFHIF